MCSFWIPRFWIQRSFCIRLCSKQIDNGSQKWPTSPKYAQVMFRIVLGSVTEGSQTLSATFSFLCGMITQGVYLFCHVWYVYILPDSTWPFQFFWFYRLVIKFGNGKSLTIYRWFSYWTSHSWGFSIAMFYYQRVSLCFFLPCFLTISSAPAGCGTPLGTSWAGPSDVHLAWFPRVFVAALYGKNVKKKQF